jgi:hypothetical protein
MILSVAGLTDDIKPDEAGTDRINAVAIAFIERKCDSVCVIGGKTNRYSIGFAGAYRNFMSQPSKATDGRVVFYDASATNSQRDIEAALPKIDEFLKTLNLDRATAKIGVVSYPLHRERMMVILKHFGFENFVEYESCETPTFNPILDRLLLWLTMLDPTWRWLGAPLNWWSKKLIEKPSKK